MDELTEKEIRLIVERFKIEIEWGEDGYGIADLALMRSIVSKLSHKLPSTTTQQ